MGKRGEGWLVLQLALFALILIAPALGLLALPPWTRILGWALIAVGGVFGTGGVLALGRNLTPFPRPIEGGKLVTGGVYRIVRHPIYTGLIFGTLGWGLVRGNETGLTLAIVLFAFFDVKSRREERWLLQTYEGYAAYRQRVRKLIPWLY
jgi:protein-S-isoprenylcysteine O-methyltransferase Ste14